MKKFDQTSKGKKVKDKVGSTIQKEGGGEYGRSQTSKTIGSEEDDDDVDAKAVKDARDALKSRLSRSNT